MQLSIIVPTYNEAPNIVELVRRLEIALAGLDAEVVFIDDSTDHTPTVISEAAESARIPVRQVHRESPTGGLGGAVVEGLSRSTARWCVVMDGDLQHPPELIPRMIERMSQQDVDVVVASRYATDGNASGLASQLRHSVSRSATLVTKAMFPVRLRDTTDPMTGFFLVDRDAVNLAGLHPRGFKILLEILARQRMRIAEIPFDFATRTAGESKATMRQGMRFFAQLGALRFGRMPAFAVIGGVGAVANIAIVWLLTAVGTEYLIAAIIATETTIIANFVWQEHWVFRDLRAGASPLPRRFLVAFGFNNAEALIRIPIVALMVEAGHFTVVLATAITLAIAFIVRFTFQSLVVYAPRRS